MKLEGAIVSKAIFLDRDGIINVDKAYVSKIEDFDFCEGIFEVLKHFQSLGYLLIIVTNQSGIGRGYYTQEDFDILTAWILAELKKEEIEIQAVYHCPHAPEDSCDCRKPNSKMLQDAIKEFDINVKNSWMIGDKLSDIEAGKNAHIDNTIFVNSSTCRVAKYNITSILESIDIVKK